MHPRIELAALFVDVDLGHADFYRAVDEMDDPVRILNDAQYSAFADPASIEGLPSALRVKQCCAQHHSEFALVGCAVQDFHVGLEVITMEKKAKRHSPCPNLNFYFLLYEGWNSVIIRSNIKGLLRCEHKSSTAAAG
ncbi:hypothetical protein PS712_06053 [Pseudomonas fluorescens]|uniref:Uncharacterized protein n=1 Tax=Pseudomonas fluorescens TaxID=294 RepID=A0A5E7FW41_PSEFL|nr:hypothetical protein PS712_06041 [Pseudomonas fluorescens]VVO42832.1 hypothetical protein PS712_06053 [Pseudomonas fluorescens]